MQNICSCDYSADRPGVKRICYSTGTASSCLFGENSVGGRVCSLGLEDCYFLKVLRGRCCVALSVLIAVIVAVCLIFHPPLIDKVLHLGVERGADALA